MELQVRELSESHWLLLMSVDVVNMLWSRVTADQRPNQIIKPVHSQQHEQALYPNDGWFDYYIDIEGNKAFSIEIIVFFYWWRLSVVKQKFKDPQISSAWRECRPDPSHSPRPRQSPEEYPPRQRSERDPSAPESRCPEPGGRGLVISWSMWQILSDDRPGLLCTCPRISSGGWEGHYQSGALSRTEKIR